MLLKQTNKVLELCRGAFSPGIFPCEFVWDFPLPPSSDMWPWQVVLS